MNYQGIFKRYEKKYRLTKSQYNNLLFKLNPYMQRDEYGVYTICNLYFDTDDYALIRHSIQKPVYKEKLRLRSYGIPEKNTPVYLELKKKYKGVVYKRRVSLPYHDAMNYLRGKAKPENSQIMQEINWFMDYHHPKPKAFVAYDRLALFGKENPDLRVTFDFGIRCRDNRLDMTKGTQGNPILNQDTVLMEIKIPGAMPLWMSTILNEMEIFPQSFSKYGEFYKQYLINQMQGGVSHAG